MRPKFNDALNTAVAKIDQYIMTINSCNTQYHFDCWGNLSQKGKNALWMEIDDLIERFDSDAVKLLPTPKNTGLKYNYRNFNRGPDQTRNRVPGYNRQLNIKDSRFHRGHYNY